jgi:hypothetical protein
MIPPVPGKPGKPNPWLRVPRYTRRVQALFDRSLEDGSIRPGTSAELDIYHDAECDAINDKGACNCSPCVGLIREVGPGPYPETAVVLLVHKPKRT